MPTNLRAMQRQYLEVLDEEERNLSAALEKVRARRMTLQAWMAEDAEDADDTHVGPTHKNYLAQISAPRNTDVVAVDTLVTPRPGLAESVEPLSIAAAGERALQVVGRHMRPRAIADSIVRHNIPVNAKPERLAETVGAVLARRASEGKLFSRPATGLYGLLEWNGPGPRETAEELKAATGEGSMIGFGL